MIKKRATCEIDAVNKSLLLLRLCATFAVNGWWNINALSPLILAYVENGLRTQKIYNSITTTNYYYNGSILMGMVTGSGSTAIHQLFSYDSSGNVVSVDYSTNGGSTFTTYYYVRNAQNDVVKLISGSGTTVVEYTYDTWGKLLTTTGSLASTLGANQPFRYRGYVYDTETGWYYLQSRYYDPSIGRFISADVLLSTGQGVLGHNAFAYCLNNPVNRFDDSGNESESIGELLESWLKPILSIIKENSNEETQFVIDLLFVTLESITTTGEKIQSQEDGIYIMTGTSDGLPILGLSICIDDLSVSIYGTGGMLQVEVGFGNTSIGIGVGIKDRGWNSTLSFDVSITTEISEGMYSQYVTETASINVRLDFVTLIAFAYCLASLIPTIITELPGVSPVPSPVYFTA